MLFAFRKGGGISLDQNSQSANVSWRCWNLIWVFPIGRVGWKKHELAWKLLEPTLCDGWNEEGVTVVTEENFHWQMVFVDYLRAQTGSSTSASVLQTHSFCAAVQDRLIWGNKMDWVTGTSLNGRLGDLQITLQALVRSCRSPRGTWYHKRLVHEGKSIGREEMGSWENTEV